MGSATIDTATAKRLAQAGAIRGASIVGQPGGWLVVIKYGMHERPLGAQRTDRPRIWRSLDRLADYCRKELQLVRFDQLDAAQR